MMDNKELKLFSLRSFMILLYTVVVAVIPLVIRMRFVEFRSPVETWHRLASKTIPEVFARFRLELLILVVILIIIAALLKYYYEYEKGTIKNSYADYPVVIFALFIVLSALFSPYINIAFWGYYDRGEGAFAYLSYLIIFLVAANFINADQDKRIIFYAAIGAGLVQSLVAISQFFGFDVLQTKPAVRFFIPAEYMAQVEDVQFRFAYKAYGTTYNPNYLGGYMSLIFPMALVMYLFSKTRKEMLFWLAVYMITLAGFFAPTSIGAFIAVAAVLVIFFTITRGEFKKYSKKLLVALIIVVAVTGVSEAMSGGMITRRVTRFLNELFRGEPSVGLMAEPLPYLPFREEKKLNIYIYRNSLDSFASNRGYIWRKSLEMLKGNIFLGEGFDTYVYNFPHWDPHRDHDLFKVGLLIDKPHNTYLQVALGAGLAGLLIYLYILFDHMRRYLRVFRLRRIKEKSDVIMLALFAGWLGYLFQGLSNDSVLSNAPVFWALFGISVNYVKNALLLEPFQLGRGKEEKKGSGKKEEKKKGNGREKKGGRKGSQRGVKNKGKRK